MTSERRSTSRCPICQGPAVSDKNHPEGVRCRNSACRHNHHTTECPRCRAKDIAQATWRDDKWNYTCSDCEHVWTV